MRCAVESSANIAHSEDKSTNRAVQEIGIETREKMKEILYSNFGLLFKKIQHSTFKIQNSSSICYSLLSPVSVRFAGAS